MIATRHLGGFSLREHHLDALTVDLGAVEMLDCGERRRSVRKIEVCIPSRDLDNRVDDHFD